MRTLQYIVFTLFCFACSEGGDPLDSSPPAFDSKAIDGLVSQEDAGAPEDPPQGFAGSGPILNTLEHDAGSSDPEDPPDTGPPPDSTDAGSEPDDAGEDAGEPDSAVEPEPDAGEPDAGEPDSGPVFECTFDADCDDDNECTEDTCVDHVCLHDAEVTEGADCSDPGHGPDYDAIGGTCRSGACCAGCYDSVLGCVYDDTLNNAASCGKRGANCNICQNNVPWCSSGQCCQDGNPDNCSPLRWD